MTTETSPRPADTGPRPAPEEPVTGAQWLRAAALLGLFVLLGLTTGWWGLAIVVGIVVMIFLHELGHYLTARWSGMKVTEFFFGFGPRIWSFHRGETEYGVKAIPAGAYVKIIGMHNIEDVPPEDEALTYRQKPFWQRFSVAVAGSTMHAIQALVLLFVLLTFVGVPGGELFPEDRDPKAWVIGAVVDGTAAEDAGLATGDKLLAIDGEPVPEFADLRDHVADRPGEAITITIERDGRRQEVAATLGSRTIDGEELGFLGIGQTLPTETVGWGDAVPKTLDGFVETTWQSLKGMGRLFSPSGLSSYSRQVVNAQSDREEAEERSEAVENLNQGGSGSTTDLEGGDGSDRVMSLLGVFRIGVQLGDSGGVAAVIMLFVAINIFVGLFNLVPLLPFDGGHVAVAVYEKIREFGLHPRRRYFADVNKLLPLTYAVVVLLGGLFLTSLYVDLANPLDVSG